jgi:hypothetical protein
MLTPIVIELARLSAHAPAPVVETTRSSDERGDPLSEDVDPP